MKDALQETLIIDSEGFEECIFVLIAIDFGMGIFYSMETLLHYPCTYLTCKFGSNRDDENGGHFFRQPLYQ